MVALPNDPYDPISRLHHEQQAGANALQAIQMAKNQPKDPNMTVGRAFRESAKATLIYMGITIRLLALGIVISEVFF